MPAQRTIGAIPAAHRSVFAQVGGVQAWAAVLIALTATLSGFAIEVGSGHRELGTVFALCYAAGCIGAVLAVRQSNVFTAVIQPPLLLFVAVPLAYFLMHGSEVNGLKGFLITCGYPLIERFPLMLFTSAAVLVAGMVRWYLAMSSHESAEPAAGLLAGLVARWSAGRRPNHGIERTPRTPRPPRTAGPPRPPRPPRPERSERSERERPSPQRSRAPRADRGETRRRPRPAGEAAWAPEPRRRVARERREVYPPRDPYPPYDPYRSRPQPATRGGNTHHPVSRVRYRGSDPGHPDPPVPRGR